MFIVTFWEQVFHFNWVTLINIIKPHWRLHQNTVYVWYTKWFLNSMPSCLRSQRSRKVHWCFWLNLEVRLCCWDSCWLINTHPLLWSVSYPNNHNSASTFAYVSTHWLDVCLCACVKQEGSISKPFDTYFGNNWYISKLNDKLRACRF